MERLFAVIDGLAVHAASRPGSQDAVTMRAVLASHLEAIIQPRATG